MLRHPPLLLCRGRGVTPKPTLCAPTMDACSTRSAWTRATPRRDTFRRRIVPSVDTNRSSDSSSLRCTGCTMVQSSSEPRSTPSWISESIICGLIRSAKKARSTTPSSDRVSPTPYEDCTITRRMPARRAAASTAMVPRERTSPGVPCAPRSRTRRAGSEMPRVTMTASWPGMVRSRKAESVASPFTRVRPGRAGMASAWRATAVTRWPLPSSASDTARPDPPVAPMTRMFMGFSVRQVACSESTMPTLALGVLDDLSFIRTRNLDRSSGES